MGIRESHPAVYDDKHFVIDVLDRTSITCDRCPSGGAIKLKPNKLVFEFIGLEAVLDRLASAGWTAKTGYIPAGSVNPKTGAVMKRGKHTAHVCICPKCRGMRTK